MLTTALEKKRKYLADARKKVIEGLTKAGFSENSPTWKLVLETYDTGVSVGDSATSGWYMDMGCYP